MIQNFFRVLFSVLLALIVCGVVSVAIASSFASLYETVTGSSLGSSFLDFTEVVGFLFAFLFSLAISGGIFVDATRYTLVAATAVLVVFIIWLDPQTFYIPIAIALVGTGLGWGVRRLYISLKK